jgi:DnaK suppressor protein
MIRSRREEAIQELRTKLVMRKALLSRRLANARKYVIQTTADQRLEGTSGTHLADEASDMIATEILVSDIDAINESIEQIDDALDRIDAGTYGLCKDCDLEIDVARLELLPTASRCTRCQTRAEALT